MAGACTTDMDTIRSFYGDGLGLRITGPLKITREVGEIQRALWGIPEDIGWELYVMDRPAVPGTIQVRVLLLVGRGRLPGASYGEQALLVEQVAGEADAREAYEFPIGTNLGHAARCHEGRMTRQVGHA